MLGTLSINTLVNGQDCLQRDMHVELQENVALLLLIDPPCPSGFRPWIPD